MRVPGGQWGQRWGRLGSVTRGTSAADSSAAAGRRHVAMHVLGCRARGGVVAGVCCEKWNIVEWENQLHANLWKERGEKTGFTWDILLGVMCAEGSMLPELEWP